MKDSTNNLTAVHGEPAYRLETPRVEAFLTRRGGHLGPVRFVLGRRCVCPYSLPPWKPGECEKGTAPILQLLRGDFFCLPFGDDPKAPPVHGETANNTWKVRECAGGRLVADIRTKAGGRIRKVIVADRERPVIYQEHTVGGLTGRYNFGHHTILAFPEKGGPCRVNVSPFHFGQVKPEPFTNPAIGEYSALKTGARIRTLKKVALATGGSTSLHEYPAREGFEDLVMVSSRPGDFAWTAVTFDRYVWIQLKDPRILPSTLFWFTNGGRHYPPWNGKHRHRLGLEEVCSHFNDGLSVSREERLKKEGAPTSRRFRSGECLPVRLIHAVHPVGTDFGMVTEIVRHDSETLRVRGERGETVNVPVRWEFLYGPANKVDRNEKQ